MHIATVQEDDIPRLQELIVRERSALQRDRYRAVWLAIQGQEACRIAAMIGRSRRSVQAWAYAYRDGGVGALTPKRCGGKKPRMSERERLCFAQRIRAGPVAGDGVCTLRGRDAQRILREEFGRPYSLGGAYGLLYRLGFSSLSPRPRHRQSDPAAQEKFQADAPLLSRA